MKKVVFYSWQSALPNRTNRGLIQEALSRAVNAILADDSIQVEPVMDRDTAGVAGSPDIAGTIFAKISAADIFVPDVSLITAPDAKRPAPNPNVLLELGYAIHSLGWARIVMVMNTAYGGIDKLPFDLRGRRAIDYSVPDVEGEKAPERRRLAAELTAALRGIFEHSIVSSAIEESDSIEDDVLASIDRQAADRVAKTRALWPTSIGVSKQSLPI